MSKKNDFNRSENPQDLSGSETAEHFAQRRDRADFRAFDKIMNRKRGEKPREGDEV